MWAAEAGVGGALHCSASCLASGPLHGGPCLRSGSLEDHNIKHQANANDQGLGQPGKAGGTVLSPLLIVPKFWMADTVRKGRRGDSNLQEVSWHTKAPEGPNLRDFPYLQRGVGTALCKLSFLRP